MEPVSKLRWSVLVVDDDADSCEFVKNLLGEEGFDVSAAADFLQAYSLLVKRPFDLLITDLRMPGRDGFSVLAKAREIRPGMPMVVLTAYPTWENFLKVRHIGGIDMVDKCSGPQVLLRAAQSALSESNAGEY
jgi:DNA-binding response OmpR family regulator